MDSSHNEANEQSQQDETSEPISTMNMFNFKKIQIMCTLDQSYVVAENVLERLQIRVDIIDFIKCE
jgi:hypothetical protein